MIIIAFIATLTVILVTAETDDENDEEKSSFEFRHEKRRGEHQPYTFNLTEEERIEIELLRESMIEEGATPEEIHEAVTTKLAEFGFDLPDRDEQLDNEIEQTKKQLEILERQKELRDEGYSWDEIQDKIEEEFDSIEFERHSPFMIEKNRFHPSISPRENNHFPEDKGESEILS